ncbi:hypothetical protein LOTGIDRAFT_229463 [Lottia gigantea]|uniref:Uncharacterized protein n=1 Tax=Lottia gigantea TaxID=225164 RepID=V3ZMT0_LOTGI|nr:hypothetical protein LOTGIDRAFT_229463 [Lottia gigantea]ESO85622.1 hypothetical protein LOTGIDRAFT_229463 [Lottia gigantea]
MSSGFPCNPKRIMSLPTGTIIKYIASHGLFSEEKKFFLEKYEEYINFMKDHDDELHKEDCVDGPVTSLCESVSEMSPLLIGLVIRVFNYMEKMENERIQSKMIREHLEKKSSDIFDSNIFPKFELDIESNITVRRVGRELRVIKCFFESVKDVETSTDSDDEFQNFLIEIVDILESMEVHHSIICHFLELEMDNSEVSIEYNLIDNEVRSERFQRHYQLACVALKYLTSLYKELENVYKIPVCDSNWF